MKKNLLILAGVLAALFLLLNVSWLIWRNAAYAPYIVEMTASDISDNIVPRYTLIDSDGYSFVARYPGYLSFTGYLEVTAPLTEGNQFAETLTVLPLMNGEFDYKVTLCEDGLKETIYIDRNGNALNIENNEIVERNRSNITSLLEKANDVWSIER